MDKINNLEDYLDSRDVQERINWLKSDEAKNTAGDPFAWADKEIEEFAEELKALVELKEQYVNAFGESSWDFGAQFIRQSHFEDYAWELADDIGAIDAKQRWPLNCIDWERAAEELAMDYYEFDFDGVIYLAREA